jgi:hypothetical protein
MDSHRRLYLFGIALLGIGIYQIFKKDFVEFSLYATAGLSFVVNGLTNESSLAKFKKPLVIVSWIFIGATALLFLYLLQFKFA